MQHKCKHLHLRMVSHHHFRVRLSSKLEIKHMESKAVGKKKGNSAVDGLKSDEA